MSLMRALKGVATGYLGARVDMMAQEAAKKREDELLQAEREFKDKQQDDLLKGQLHNKIETLIKTEELESDRIRKEKEQKTDVIDNIFVTLKKYTNTNDDNESKKKLLVTENANVFKYKGKIEEYTSSKKIKNDKVLKLDFLTFKKMMSESEEKKKLA